MKGEGGTWKRKRTYMLQRDKEEEGANRRNGKGEKIKAQEVRDSKGTKRRRIAKRGRGKVVINRERGTRRRKE